MALKGFLVKRTTTLVAGNQVVADPSSCILGFKLGLDNLGLRYDLEIVEVERVLNVHRLHSHRCIPRVRRGLNRDQGELLLFPR